MRQSWRGRCRVTIEMNCTYIHIHTYICLFVVIVNYNILREFQFLCSLNLDLLSFRMLDSGAQCYSSRGNAGTGKQRLLLPPPPTRCPNSQHILSHYVCIMKQIVLCIVPTVTAALQRRHPASVRASCDT